MAFSFGQSVQFRANDRRRGSYISRQNDPAYNREVQYTHNECTEEKYTHAQIVEVVRMLCKDQGLNIPNTNNGEFLGVCTLPVFNNRVEVYMALATPLPKAQVSKQE